MLLTNRKVQERAKGRIRGKSDKVIRVGGQEGGSQGKMARRKVGWQGCAVM